MTRFTIFTASLLTLIAISGNDKSSKNKPAKQKQAETSVQPTNTNEINTAKAGIDAMVVNNTGDTVYYKPIITKRKIKFP